MEKYTEEDKPKSLNVTATDGVNLESCYRLVIKQTAKGNYYFEFRVLADDEETMEKRFQWIKEFALKQMRTLNGGTE